MSSALEGPKYSSCQDFVSALPVEVLKGVFDETMMLVDERDTDMVEMLSPSHQSYIKQSIAISHISSYWRRIAISIPNLWPVINGMHPDALRTFLDRTRLSGFHVTMVDDPEASFEYWKQTYDQLMDELGGRFSEIKILRVDVSFPEVLVEVLKLGRQATMAKLVEARITAELVRSYLDEDTPSDIYEVFASGPVLDWDMPVISSISCDNVFPTPHLSIGAMPNISLSVSEMDTMQPILLSRMLYQCFSSLSISSVRARRILLDESMRREAIIFPRLTYLSIRLNDPEDPRFLTHASNFNRLRLPALLHLDLELRLQLDAQSQLLEVFESMKNLQKLSLFSCAIPVEYFFKNDFFPRLTEVQISAFRATEDILMRVQSPGVLNIHFPSSLKKISLHCPNASTLLNEVVQLLEALHRQFAEDYDHGLLELILWGTGIDRQQLEGRVEEDVAKRLVGLDPGGDDGRLLSLVARLL